MKHYKNKFHELIIQLLWELGGSVLIAIGIYNFAVQAEFPMTGFSGISIILYRFLVALYIQPLMRTK